MSGYPQNLIGPGEAAPTACWPHGAKTAVQIIINEDGKPGQGVIRHRGVWYGVSATNSGDGLFAVADWIGTGANLDEFPFDDPPIITE